VSIIQFDIRHPNGQRESTVVEGERALIGSASHCDVRLPMDQAAFEHVLIEVVGNTLRATAKADRPPPTINGMPLTASPLADDSALGIGRIRLFVTFVADVPDGARAATSKKKGGGPGTQVALLAGFAVAAYFLLSSSDAPIAEAPEETPKLFAEPVTTCPKLNPQQAVALADDQTALADSKRERMPFLITDGVAAVGIYETTAACYRVGGMQAEARAADETASALRRQLSNDFRSRRLRLSQMLKVEDWDMARRDALVLRSLLHGKKGSYVEWLNGVLKQLKDRLPAE
jgi:hypothetical protein